LLPTPVVWRDRVVVTSFDGPVRCFDTRTAKLVWKRDDLPSESAPVVVDDVLYVATTDGVLVALDPAAKGKTLYKTELSGRTVGDLQARDDRVYAATSAGRVVCVDGRRVRRGRVLWRAEIGAAAEAAPSIGESVLAVCSIEGALLALDPSTGEKLWQRIVTQGERVRGPAIGGGRVIVAVGPRLLGIDAATGEPSDHFEGRVEWSVPPVVAGDTVLVGDREGRVTVLDARELRVRHQLRGEAAVAGPIAVSSDGWLVVGFEDRTLRCYAPE